MSVCLRLIFTCYLAVFPAVSWAEINVGNVLNFLQKLAPPQQQSEEKSEPKKSTGNWNRKSDREGETISSRYPAPNSQVLLLSTPANRDKDIRRFLRESGIACVNDNRNRGRWGKHLWIGPFDSNFPKNYQAMLEQSLSDDFGLITQWQKIFSSGLVDYDSYIQTFGKTDCPVNLGTFGNEKLSYTGLEEIRLQNEKIRDSKIWELAQRQPPLTNQEMLKELAEFGVDAELLTSLLTSWSVSSYEARLAQYEEEQLSLEIRVEFQLAVNDDLILTDDAIAYRLRTFNLSTQDVVELRQQFGIPSYEQRIKELALKILRNPSHVLKTNNDVAKEVSKALIEPVDSDWVAEIRRSENIPTYQEQVVKAQTDLALQILTNESEGIKTDSDVAEEVSSVFGESIDADWVATVRSEANILTYEQRIEMYKNRQSKKALEKVWGFVQLLYFHHVQIDEVCLKTNVTQKNDDSIVKLESLIKQTIDMVVNEPTLIVPGAIIDESTVQDRKDLAYKNAIKQFKDLMSDAANWEAQLGFGMIMGGAKSGLVDPSTYRAICTPLIRRTSAQVSKYKSELDEIQSTRNHGGTPEVRAPF